MSCWRVPFVPLARLVAIPLGLLRHGGVRADGLIVVEPPARDPVCPGPVAIGHQLAIRSHRLDVEIRNQVAQTRIVQVFHNPDPSPAEGTHLFPTPVGITVGGFPIWVDGENPGLLTAVVHLSVRFGVVTPYT